METVLNDDFDFHSILIGQAWIRLTAITSYHTLSPLGPFCPGEPAIPAGPCVPGSPAGPEEPAGPLSPWKENTIINSQTLILQDDKIASN